MTDGENMVYHCTEYNCTVPTLPCPYCGSDDHDPAPALATDL